MQNKEAEGGESSLKDVPIPSAWGKNLPEALNDLHSSHRMELGDKEGRVQLCSLTWSDDQP